MTFCSREDHVALVAVLLHRDCVTGIMLNMPESFYVVLVAALLRCVCDMTHVLCVKFRSREAYVALVAVLLQCCCSCSAVTSCVCLYCF